MGEPVSCYRLSYRPLLFEDTRPYATDYRPSRHHAKILWSVVILARSAHAYFSSEQRWPRSVDPVLIFVSDFLGILTVV